MRRYNEEQISVIEQGELLGITREQAELYSNPAYNWKQMYEIQQGILNGLSVSQVKLFADPSVASDEMYQKRKLLERGMGISDSEDCLLDDKDVREVLDILYNNHMEKEGDLVKQILSQVDVMSSLLINQENSLIKIEKEYQALKNSGFKDALFDALKEIKYDTLSFRKKLKLFIKEVKEDCKLLAETFRISGKAAFYKGFQSFSHKLKTGFEKLQKECDKRCLVTDLYIKDLCARLEEMEIDSLSIRGKYIQSTIVELHIKKKNLMNRSKSFALCSQKADALEKLFKDCVKETKRDLNHLIRDAERKRNKVQKTHTIEKEKIARRG